MNYLWNSQATYRFCLCLVIACLLLYGTGYAKKTAIQDLAAKLQKVIDTASAKIGIGILGLDFRDSLVLNGQYRFPMQSVYKFPLAIAVLTDVDKGELALAQSIHIPAQSLDTATWSPLVKEYPHRDIDISLSDVLRYAISKSDNNACDILFRLAGGTASVNNYIHRLGIADMALKATEAEMKTAWPVQYTNWCRPAAMLRLLRLFYEGRLLSKESTALLMRWMTESENPPNRIKGLLPADAVVAHKTGTSDTNSQGMKAATNDVGIIILPDGRHYALVVYVSDYKGGVDRGAHIIATISRIVWDYFTQRSSHHGLHRQGH